MQPKQPNQSFWKDEPELQTISHLNMGIFLSLFTVYRVLFAVLSFGLVFTFFYWLSPVLAWGWLGFLLIAIGVGIYRGRRRKLEIREIAQIQQRAFERTKASLIGSAVHVAGHPLLEREQSVVLALILPNLAIYAFETDQPLIIIPLRQIVSIQTVVYDDERIPHIDVVDSSAQALQIVLKYGNQEIACLFRRMKKARPIDWYQAIQKSRGMGENVTA